MPPQRLYKWGWGTVVEVKILEPRGLRDRVVAGAQELLDLYRRPITER